MCVIIVFKTWHKHRCLQPLIFCPHDVMNLFVVISCVLYIWSFMQVICNCCTCYRIQMHLWIISKLVVISLVFLMQREE